MTAEDEVRWWTFRRAQSRRPRTYRCPFCNRPLPAMEEHALITPEGDGSRRRHAHTECVIAERKAGRLPSRDEWKRSQPRSERGWRGLLARLIGRG